MGELDLTLLGGFELTVDGETVGMPHSAQRLLAFLAVNDRPVRRCYAGSTLWFDSSETHSSGCLRSTLWRLRRAGGALVQLRGDCLRLSPGVTTDVREVWDLSHRLMQGERALDPFALRRLREAGDLLPGWYEDWVVMERERTRQLRIQALEAASDLLVDTERHREAVLLAQAAVEADPLRESAHRTLIRSQLAAGNRGDALYQCQRFAEVLWHELRLEPSPEMQRLASTLRLAAAAV